MTLTAHTRPGGGKKNFHGPSRSCCHSLARAVPFFPWETDPHPHPGGIEKFTERSRSGAILAGRKTPVFECRTLRFFQFQLNRKAL